MIDDPAAAIAAALDRLIPDRSSAIGVAVSGGSDSMALLEAARGWHGAAVRAATVDHGLRPEARAEAEAVKGFCAKHTIPHDTLPIDPLPEGGNLSAALRDARYAALARWAEAQGIGTVLLGHTLDDQAETVLLRLARGSGAEGLSGMAEAREDLGLRWLRPMLSLRRAALRDWLSSKGVGWSDDPTNEDERFDRVKARAALAALAPLGLTAEGLTETADRLRRQRAVLEEAAALLEAAAMLAPVEDGLVRLDRETLVAAQPDSALRVLADVLRRVSGRPYRPRFRSLERLWDRIASGECFRATLSGCIVCTQEDPSEVRILPEPAAMHPS